MMELRKASTSQVKQLVDFVNQSYRGEVSRGGWTTEADFLDGQRVDEDMLLESMESKAKDILCLIDGAELKACCEVHRRSRDVAEVGMICVPPVAQGQGLGRKMIAEAEAYIRSEWPDVLFFQMMVISLRDSLLAWYERLGYQQTGESESFPSHDPKFGIPKVEGLKFLVLRKSVNCAR